MNNKSKQKAGKSLQNVIGAEMPKRFVNMIVDYLNNHGFKSLNGCEYNYHKVYQVLIGRWTDDNVELAKKSVMLDIKKAELKRAELDKELEELNRQLEQV